MAPAGAPPQTPFRRGLGAGAASGVRGGAPAGVWGGAPSNILAAKPPRGLGWSPNRRGPPGPPLLATSLQAGRVLSQGYVFMSQKFSPPAPSIRLSHFSESWTFYLSVITCAIVLSIIRKFMATVLLPKQIRSFLTRYKVLTAFFLGIFFRYLGSDLVMLFNNAFPREKFQSTDDVLRGLEYSQIKIVVLTKLYFDTVVNPKNFKLDPKAPILERFHKIAEYNKPVLAQNEKQVATLLRDKNMKYFFLTDTIDLPYFLSRFNDFCDIAVVYDKQLPTMFTTIYHRNNLTVGKAGQRIFELVQTEYTRLQVQSRKHKE